MSSRGKWRSKSYSPLRTGVSELPGWDWKPSLLGEASRLELPKAHGPGEAPLERLPTEVLGMLAGLSNLSLETLTMC